MRWTHHLTAEREEQVGEGDYGDPIYDTTTVLEGEPVRYRSGGTSYVRGDTGERVQEAPTVVGRGALAEQIREGDVVSLDPMAPGAAGIERVEVTSIKTAIGRGVGAEQTTLELEGI